MQERVVATPGELLGLVEELRGAPWLALDTEFIREKTYYPQLCLIQVATPEVVACVDPLAVADLGPLLDVIYDPATTKVMHAARQDLEILLQLRGALPVPLFDTQVAATVLGYGEQVGYGALVRQVLGVDLDKSHSRTDWARRPLDPEQLRYAADDVRYLGKVYQVLLEQLAAKDRLAWLAEDFAELADPRTYRTEPAEAWLRIKGAGKLKGAQLAVLQALSAWREEQAVKSDRPRRWLLKDELLLDLARLMPDSAAKLERMRGLEGSSVAKFGAEWVARIAAAKKLPREQWPVLELSERLTVEQDAVVDLLMAVLRQIGAEQDVTPSAIANRRDLEQLVLGNSEVPLLHGWRGAVAGQILRDVAVGHLRVRVEGGALVLDAA